MGSLPFLVGALFCASCGMGHVYATDNTRTYTLPGGGTLAVQIERQASGSPVQTAGYSSGSMSFAGPSGSSGGYRITSSVNVSGDQPLIVPEVATGGTGYFASSYERSESKAPAPRPRTETHILYGWVPEPEEGVSLQALNAEELNSSLRNNAFVQKLRSTRLNR